MRYLSFFVIISLIVFNACSKAKDENLTKRAGAPEMTMVDVIKKRRLAEFQHETIGKAFDSYKYLSDKKWRSTVLKSGHVTVDFSGWFKDLTDEERNRGVKKKGLEIKFVIEPDGTYYAFMVTKLEEVADGSVLRYPYSDLKGILMAIYANERVKI